MLPALSIGVNGEIQRSRMIRYVSVVESNSLPVNDIQVVLA